MKRHDVRTTKIGTLRSAWVRTARISVLLISLTSAAPSLSISYSAESIEGWVVDAETGAPIEDVVVVAHWQLRGPIEGNPAGDVTVLETTTDKEGHYFFSAWGPTAVVDPTALLWRDDPMMHFFKSDYELLTLHNRATVKMENALRPMRSSDWNGKTIRLKNFHHDDVKYSKNIDMGAVAIDDLTVYASACEWKSIPLLVTRMEKERARLNAVGLFPALPRLERFAHQDRCGSSLVWSQGLPK
jgi:hypothetical protein